MIRSLPNTLRGATTLLWSIAVTGLLAAPVWSQEVSTPQPGQSTMTGEVVSSTRYTLVVRSETGQFQLFDIDQATVRPPTLPVGSVVRVVSIPGEEPSVRVATEITVTGSPSPERSGTQPPAVPAEIREIERDIERQVRRYQAGVRAGVGLDPELVLVGVHAQVGPFFSPNVYFRPNAEFAYGEVTALFALNLEAIYRLPISSRLGRWTTYFGAGPSFSFLHQNFERDTDEDRIDFGDFDSDIGLNFLGGIRYRGGMFMELKTSIYARPTPTMRLIVGYNF
jgi:hypothetical protein